MVLEHTVEVPATTAAELTMFISTKNMEAEKWLGFGRTASKVGCLSNSTAGLQLEVWCLCHADTRLL